MGEPNDEPITVIDDEEPPPLPPDPLPSPPGKIVKAYDYSEYVELVVVRTGQTEELPFTLSPDDHYGDSDAWRAEYERALAAGEVTPEPPPPIAGPLA